MSVNELARAVAALVAVVSLAMIGIAVRLLPQCWNRFHDYFRILPASARKSALPLLVLTHLPMLLAVVFALLSVKLADHMPGIFIFVIIGITLLMLVIESGTAIRRKIKKQTVVKLGELEMYAPSYFTALQYMALSVWFNIVALIGVSPTMLLIDIGPVGPENYEWGQWSLYIAIFLFCVGIIVFGLTLVFDKARERK